MIRLIVWLCFSCSLFGAEISKDKFAPLNDKQPEGFNKIIALEQMKIPPKPTGEGWQYDPIKKVWWRYASISKIEEYCPDNT